MSQSLLIPELLPAAPARVWSAARLAVARSPLFRRAHVRVPWELAKDLYDQARILQWTEGLHSPLFINALRARDSQIALTALLLWREDARVRQHIESVNGVADHLLNILDESVGIRAARSFVVVSPRGNPFGAKRDYAQTWSEEDLRTTIPVIIERLSARYRREHVKRPNWVKDIARELRNVKPVTVYHYLRTYPELQLALDAAKSTNKGIAERALPRG